MPMPRFSTGTCVMSSAADEDAARRRLLETRQHGERCGLARAGRPEQRQELAVGDLEIERTHGIDLAVVALSHIDEPHQRFGQSRSHSDQDDGGPFDAVERIPCQCRTMRIATYNVNGVNGRLPVLLRWLEQAKPDVVCLQELKAPEEKFPEAAIARRATARSGTARRAGTASRSWRAARSRWRRGAACRAIRKTAQPLYRSHGRWDHDRLPLSTERQSRARPEVRLQAEMVRAADPDARRAAEEQDARRAGRRLQRHADRAGRLQAGALASTTRCSAPRRARRSRLSEQGWTDAVRKLHPDERSTRSGITSGMPGRATPGCASIICC